jgi:hypothetical protein
MNKKPFGSLEFAYSRLENVLCPIGLNATNGNKPENSLKKAII